MSNLLTVTDQMDREVTFSFPPRRIISLVPSQTEFLLDIGAPVIGRTKFCIHPADLVKSIPIIGGTKNFRFEKIGELQPDLIIGNKEENYREGIDTLARQFPVWMSDIADFASAFAMMQELGQQCDLTEKAEGIIEQCRKRIEGIKGAKSGSVLYFIWKDPWMVAGRNTYIDSILTHLGYQNLAIEERYPTLSEEKVAQLNPEFLLLSSEPYPFKKPHLQELQQRWPDAEVKLVDGELFSWYGSRMRAWTNH